MNKLLGNQIQWYIKRSVQHDQAGFIPEMQEWFKNHKSIIVIHNINKLKDENHMIVSTGEEKAFDKIQHQFIIKFLNKVTTEVTIS